MKILLQPLFISKNLVKAAFQLLFVSALVLNFLSAQESSSSSPSKDESSQIKYRHAINICPVAPVFGIYAANYEYLFSPNNGIVARYEIESIPNSYTDANIEAKGMAFILNYRRHAKKDLKSSYAGGFVRYRIYEGYGTTEGQRFDFDRKDITVGLNVGKRWIFKKGFNINFMVGYGYSLTDRDAIPSTEKIESLIDEFEHDYDFLGSFLGEFSIGFAF